MILRRVHAARDVVPLCVHVVGGQQLEGLGVPLAKRLARSEAIDDGIEAVAVDVVNGEEKADGAVGRNGLIGVVVEPGILIVRDRLCVLLL